MPSRFNRVVPIESLPQNSSYDQTEENSDIDRLSMQVRAAHQTTTSPRNYSISQSLEVDLETAERDYITACRNDVVHMETMRESLRSRENLR